MMTSLNYKSSTLVFGDLYLPFINLRFRFMYRKLVNNIIGIIIRLGTTYFSAFWSNQEYQRNRKHGSVFNSR